MKKYFFSLVALLFTCFTFSQKIIDKPDYGMSSIPGSLTKIELTSEATILHFHIKYQPGQWIFIPKESYIEDVKGGEKQYVTKTEGIALGERYTMPESGEVHYKLYFPKLNATIKKVDFGEANEGGSWSVYDIVINEQESESLMPKVLQGNWLQTDGSNQWDYGFYHSNAIIDSAIWNYKSVENKKNNYTIVLERNGIQKTIYAQLDKKGTVKFGQITGNLVTYSTEKVYNPNYKLANDEVYSDMVFKSDSATYSGFIKGYRPREGVKTIAVHVDDIITGSQNTFIAKINEYGFFSMQLPLYYPHEVWVRSPIFNGSVYLEPGKNVFQLFADRQTLYMGKSAALNTDLDKIKNDRQFDDREVMSKILDIKAVDYKIYCQNWADKKTEKLDLLRQSNAIGAKAHQIGKLEIKYNAITQLFDYQRDFETAFRQKNKIPREQREVDFKMDTLTPAYYNFITDATFNNELAVISTHSYDGALNRLQYLDLFRIKSVSNSFLEIVDELVKSGYSLTTEEEQLVVNMKENEVFANSPAQKEFKNKYGEISTAFFSKHQKMIKEITKDGIYNSTEFEAYLVKNNIPITKEEKEYLKAEKKLTKATSPDKVKQNLATIKELEVFYQKHRSGISNLFEQKSINFRNEKLAEFFGVKAGFATDIMISQSICNSVVDQVTPLSEEDLIRVQKSIQTPFIADYLKKCNEQTLAKIEANKTKTGFAVNTVKKTEGDELFGSMISKFKGKVIYVDFWATWCAPCMSGIKTIAPLKEEMKADNVVFLYITNPSSPEKTWNNVIPNIKGEHYRVTQDEWNYLAQKFNISGIPHYVLVNKNGEVVNPKLGHNSNEGLKKILGE